MASSNLNSPVRIDKVLPKELLTEIMLRVASSSLDDVFNFMSSCRYLSQIGNADFAFQNALLEKLPVAPWPLSNRAATFLRSCVASGNPEVLFRQGMVKLFSVHDLDAGIQLLRTASDRGHKAATYVYGILFICSVGVELKQEGVRLLSVLTTSDIRACRRKVQRVIREMWIRFTLDAGDAEVGATCTCGNQSAPSNWEDEEKVGCNCCSFYPEAVYLQKLLRN